MGEVHKKLMKKWRAQVNQHTLVCYLCGKLILTQQELSADHIIPKSKGGLTISSNLKPAHKLCNCKKGSKLLSTYLKQQKRQK